VVLIRGIADHFKILTHLGGLKSLKDDAAVAELAFNSDVEEKAMPTYLELRRDIGWE
jgi:hypothetical protein